MWIYVFLSVPVIIAGLISFSCCRVASNYDDESEAMFRAITTEKE
jgi:hypothetical protein